METSLDKYYSINFICTPLRGKIPILKKWNELDHTPDYNVFKNKNIGVLTGKVSKITILDIDYNDNGMKTWKLLTSLYPKIITPICITPNKGLHIYFKYNKNISSSSRLKIDNKRIGFDILNDGRQAVIPPSTDLVNHKKYKWLNSPFTTPIIAMPTWLELFIKIYK